MTAIGTAVMLAARKLTCALTAPVAAMQHYGRARLKADEMDEMGDTDDNILLVYCTCPDEHTGAELAAHLVERGLAACVNVLPGINSIYKWRGEMQSDTEALLLIKSAATGYAALQAEIKAQHPYELPEIIAVSIATGLPDYLNWIKEETDI